jgi:hypothetical protein
MNWTWITLFSHHRHKTQIRVTHTFNTSKLTTQNLLTAKMRGISKCWSYLGPITARYLHSDNTNDVSLLEETASTSSSPLYCIENGFRQWPRRVGVGLTMNEQALLPAQQSSRDASFDQQPARVFSSVRTNFCEAYRGKGKYYTSHRPSSESLRIRT